MLYAGVDVKLSKCECRLCFYIHKSINHTCINILLKGKKTVLLLIPDEEWKKNYWNFYNRAKQEKEVERPLNEKECFTNSENFMK